MKFVVNNAHLTGKTSGKENEKKERKMDGNSKQNHVYGLSITKQWPKHAHSVMPYQAICLRFYQWYQIILYGHAHTHTRTHVYSVTSSFAADQLAHSHTSVCTAITEHTFFD